MQLRVSVIDWKNYTYDGISGAGNACPPAGLAPGAGGPPPRKRNEHENGSVGILNMTSLPPGLFGIAGAGLPPAGGGGGPRPPPTLPTDPFK